MYLPYFSSQYIYKPYSKLRFLLKGINSIFNDEKRARKPNKTLSFCGLTKNVDYTKYAQHSVVKNVALLTIHIYESLLR